MSLRLDRAEVGRLVSDLPIPEVTEAEGFTVTGIDAAMTEPLLRLARLADADRGDAQVLAPLAVREILFRALQGRLGPFLRNFADGDGRTAQIRKAVDWIVTHFDQRISIADLAGIAGMSVTSLHRHFKIVTAMSPVVYLKRVRLHKAREMLAAGVTSVSQTAFAVGYASASQFSREYARHFGNPPTQDVKRHVRSGERPRFAPVARPQHD